MQIVITQWALDSYLNLKHKNIFSIQDYKDVLRPDVASLQNYLTDPKFQNNKFWSVASSSAGTIADGFKMKWHNFGNGNIQLRLPVAIIRGDAFLCEAYVKDSDKTDNRMMLKFSVHLDMIRHNKHVERGVLK